MARRIMVWFNRQKDYEELPDDWDNMSEEAKESYLNETAWNFLQNYADFGAVVEDDGQTEFKFDD